MLPKLLLFSSPTHPHLGVIEGQNHKMAFTAKYYLMGFNVYSELKSILTTTLNKSRKIVLLSHFIIFSLHSASVFDCCTKSRLQQTDTVRGEDGISWPHFDLGHNNTREFILVQVSQKSAWIFKGFFVRLKLIKVVFFKHNNNKEQNNGRVHFCF